MELKTGLSTCSKEYGEELFMQYAKAGIKYMEIALKRDTYDDFPYAETKKWAEKYGVILWSFHLPYSPFEKVDISSPLTADKNVEDFKKLIRDFGAIGVKHFVVHASGEPINDSERPSRMERAKKSLRLLAEYADSVGAVVCVEDLPRTCLGNCSKEINELLSSHPSLRSCFDTNHLLGEKIEDYIAAVGSKIVTTHVSDYDFVNERHWLAGEGKIDWQSLLRSLTKTGYDGPWLYELGFVGRENIIRPRALTCEDFARNAKEIFEGKPVTVIGKPPKDLPFAFPPAKK